MNNIEQMKQQLLDYTRQSYKEQLFAGTSGNLSIYDPQSEIMAITPTSVNYETMNLADIVLIKLNGDLIDGSNRPSSEWRMHATIYEKQPEIKAILHSHSPYATSFAVSHEAIPVILIEMVPFLGGDIPLAQFALPGTAEVGLESLKVLNGRSACLLANHGVLAVGSDLPQAHIRAIYVEDAAKIYHFAKCNGTVHCVPDEFVQIMKNRAKNK